jgi:hypothetical protein
MKHFFKTIFILSFTLSWCMPVFAHAQAVTPTIILQHVPSTVAQQQQFYIDVVLDTHGQDINGIQGAVAFSSDNLKFVRSEIGNSNVTMWVTQSALQGNVLNFLGIIPGGFDGLINPFDPNHKLPAQIVRLVFEAKAAGPAIITASQFSVTANDGQGTLTAIPDTTTNLTVTEAIAPSTYTVTDVIPPLLSASVVTDKNLYDGKYTLIYTAIDKQSGIDHVDLQEGNGPWTRIDSPYELQDQTRKGILSLRAYDVAGNVTVISLPASPSPHPSRVPIIILALIVIIILYVIYKKTRHRHPFTGHS